MKLDNKEVKEIIKMHARGMKCPSIAKIFGVSNGTIAFLIARYKKSGFEGVRRKHSRIRYPEELKERALAEVEQGGVVSQVADNNGIPCQVLRGWMHGKVAIKYNLPKEGCSADEGLGKRGDGETDRATGKGAEGRKGEELDPKKIASLSPGSKKEERKRLALLVLGLRQKDKDTKLGPTLKSVGMPKSTYFDVLKRMERNKGRDAELMTAIREIVKEGKGTYGSPRVWLELRKRGFTVGHNKVARMMRENGLNVKRKVVKFKTFRGETGVICKNLLLEERIVPGTKKKKTLNRNFHAAKPFLKWVTDVCEFKTKEGKLYLAPIMDLYNQEIVSFVCSPSPDMAQQFLMLEKAVLYAGGNSLVNLIFHSDQGWQYQHKAFQRKLASLGIRQSMSRRGNCHDNSVMENFFGRLKNDMYYGREDQFATRESLVKAIEEYMSFYNNTRIQAKLGGMSPVKYRQAASAGIQ